MSHKNFIFPIFLLLLGAVSFLTPSFAPVQAQPNAQVAYQTPTARPDGKVIYVVQDGNTCLQIQLLTGVTIDQLKSLNKLDQNCTIRPKQELILMVVTPAASPTPNVAVSATPLLPTPTVLKGSGKICVVLYEDTNGNAIHEASEVNMEGGAVSISDQSGNVSKTGSTTSDPGNSLCPEVPEGQYNISIAIPNGYNPTTSMNRPVTVQAGDTAILEFGAQVSAAAPPPPAPVENNMLLAILGGGLVLLGIGLGIYIAITRGRS